MTSAPSRASTSAQSRTLVEGARADAARYAGQVAQDTNALNLLVGAPVDPQRLPTGFADPVTGLARLPAGLPSEVLLRRPDVLAAEHVLRADECQHRCSARGVLSVDLADRLRRVRQRPSCPACSTAGRRSGASRRRSTCRSSRAADCVPTSGRRRPSATSRSRSTRSRSSRDFAKLRTRWRSPRHLRNSARRCRRWSMRRLRGDGTDTSALQSRPRQLPAAARVAAHPLRRRAGADLDAARRAVESRGAVQGARWRLAGSRGP